VSGVQRPKYRLAEVLAGSKGKLYVGATIVEACAQRLFGFADAVLDAVFVQRQLLGGRRVGAGAEKHLQRVAQPGVRFVIDCKISKRPPYPAPGRVNVCADQRDGPNIGKGGNRAPGLAASATSWVRSA
jgi:hypothetical protein